MFIKKIFELDEILDYEKKISEAKKIKITNLSHWNTSLDFQEYMLRYIQLERISDIFSYRYTYDFSKDTRNKIVEKFIGRKDENIMCLLTPSSTCSITNIINYLKLNNFQKLCILTPAYFSVEENCKIFSLQYEKVPLRFENGKHVIPVEYILNNHFDAIWITSPVYSTGILYDSVQIERLQKLINHRILVIADETLALPKQELSRVLPINEYFFAIYSPHKPLYINSIKFSAIVCPIKNDDFFEQWIDVLGGALLHSNISAVMHYLSSNYTICAQKSIEWFSKSAEVIDQILSEFGFAWSDNSELGAYKSVHLNSLNRDSNHLCNIKKLIDTQYVSYIPGTLNGFDKKTHCFRVNLSLSTSDIENALYRILNYYA